jgi:hypothetical protein
MLEVDVLSNGTIEEVEEEIDLNAVPQPVRTMLQRFFSNLQPTKVEKSTRHNFSVWYEFEGKDQSGREVDIEISSDGQRIVIQDDQAG